VEKENGGERGGGFEEKLANPGSHGTATSLEQSQNKHQINHHPVSTNPENLVKIGPLYSEITNLEFASLNKK